MPTALITGASRGIGLGLARAFADRGWQVISTCRDPAKADALRTLAAANPHVRLERLDVSDFAQIDALASRLDGVAVDALVNNAGISGRAVFGSLDYQAWEHVLRTNLLAPVKMTEAFLDHVMSSDQRKIVSLASSLGSIESTTGGSYYYRTSKAALHMAMRSLAFDLREKGVIVGLISPGFVDTDFTRSANRPKISVAESAAGIVAAVEALRPADTGRLMRYNGEPIAW